MIIKSRELIVSIVSACLFLPLLSANADTDFPDQMSMNDAVNLTLEELKDSTYKDVEVMTTAGSMSGEFVKRSGDILILKRKTGTIHLKSNKEKVLYMFIDVKSIASISYYKLD